MARAKTTPKKQTNRKTVKGSGGISVSNKLSWKKLAILAIIIGLIGGLFVYKSYAAGPFSRGANEMSGGKLVPKNNGTGGYRELGCGKTRCVNSELNITTLVSTSELVNITQLCVHYLGGRGMLNIHSSRGTESRTNWVDGPGEVCKPISPVDRLDLSVYVRLLTGYDETVPSAQVDRIYGKY